MSCDKIEFDSDDDSWMLAAPDGPPNDNELLLNTEVDDDDDDDDDSQESPDMNLEGNGLNEDGQIDETYEVLSSHTLHSEKFKTETTEMIIRIKEIKEDPEQCIKNVFDSLLEKELKDVDKRDKVGIILNNATYNKPLYITLRPRDQMTSEVIMAEVEKIVQSNENFFLNEPLQVKITTVHLPNGQATRKFNLGLLPFEQFCEERCKSIIVIRNNDNLCLPRAIAVYLARIKYGNKHYDYRKLVRQDRSDLQQKEAAIKLCQDIGIDIADFRGDLQDVQTFQQYLQGEYEITVFDGTDRKGRTVLYRGNTGNTKYIDLLLADNHYNVITSLTGAFAFNYYCRICNYGYDHKYNHRCKAACNRCGRNVECSPEPKFYVKCKDCNINFKSQQCLDAHRLPTLEKERSICDVTKFCEKCERISTLHCGSEHKCGYKTCRNCKKYVPDNHLCYVRSKKSNIQKGKRHVDLFLFFDFESRIDAGEHIPNYCVIQHQCTVCLDKIACNIQEECRRCGKREYVLEKEGDELLEKFFDIIIGKSSFFRKIFLFAHNGGGYDFHFILNYMIMKKNWIPEVIKNGSKIMTMNFKTLVFKDSLFLFGCRLSALPKMFGIDEEVKGYFPHFFNIPKNYAYHGRIPDAKYYGPDYMSISERQKFLSWHQEQVLQNIEFNFKEEIRKYCKSDVHILRKALLSFRQLYIPLLDIDPLQSAATIASACMQGYRTKFLPQNSIGLMDFPSYRTRQNQSNVALKYLLYLEKKYDIELQSSYRGAEKKIGEYYVDGYHEAFPLSKLAKYGIKDTRKAELIIEIHGCFFHGCPRCYNKEKRYARIGDNRKGEFQTLEDRYRNTVRRMVSLRKMKPNAEILEIWECDIQNECATNTMLHKIMKNDELVVTIKSNREPFYGGRTECFRKYYKAKSGEKIKYIDVNSLYPYVNKYGEYPIGHPKVLVGNEARQCQFESTTGIAKIKIQPPNQLLYPILPIRVNKKLFFALCKICAETNQNGTCKHSNEERSFIGTYTCIEIDAAIKKGYKLLDVYEVWAYEKTQFDKKTGKGGIFADYINEFLKIKQSASGFPPHVITDSDKEEFCKKFEEKEGIALDPMEVKPNSGLRSLSKLCLNSLWGKFGQRSIMTQTAIISSEEDYYAKIIDAEKEITEISILKNNNSEKDDILLVSWRTIEECAIDKAFINPVVSAYVTAQARLHLYSYLEKLGDRVLYCDTDSIIYIQKKDDDEIETGSYLGEMGDEMDAYGIGCYILEFVCEGPKNYAYIVVDENGLFKASVTKVRGFTLNYTASEQLNFDTIKKFVTESPEPILVTEPHKIQRKKHFRIVTQPMTKKYSPIPCKRRRIENYQTVPYGWVDE